MFQATTTFNSGHIFRKCVLDIASKCTKFECTKKYDAWGKEES